MSRVSRAAPHLSLEAVEQKLKSTESYWHRQKWLIVYNGLVDPRPASAIAKQTGVSVGTVHKVISQYNQLGVAARVRASQSSFTKGVDNSHHIIIIHRSLFNFLTKTTLQCFLRVHLTLAHTSN